MAKAKLIYPLAALHGQLKDTDRYYCRMLNGQCILQRKPRRSTPAQRAMRRAFAQRYQGAHAPKSSIINHQSPIINNQSSIINHQSPIINNQSPITNHQSSLSSPVAPP